MLAGDTPASRTAAGSTDDVDDIELRVVGGFLKGNKLPLGDGVDQNDCRSDHVPVRRAAARRASTRSSSAPSRATTRPRASRRRKTAEGAPRRRPRPLGRLDHHDPRPAAPAPQSSSPASPPSRVAAGVLARPAALGAPAAARAADGARPSARPAPRPTQRIAALQAIVRARPRAPTPAPTLADAYLQKRPRDRRRRLLHRAPTASCAARCGRDPRDVGALTGRGALALAAPRLPRRPALRRAGAPRSRPELVEPYGVLVDAQVELGRYGAAGATLQRMVDLKPDLAVLRARLLLPRAARRPRRRAIEAMRLAVSAGGDAPENVAYVQTLLGNLELRRAAASRAARATPTARRSRASRATSPAAAGLARVDAARGDLGAAIRALPRAPSPACRCPSTSIALGETELAAGRAAAARGATSRWSAPSSGCCAPAASNTDVELALFEADHGTPARGRRAGAGARGPRRRACARPTRWAGR